MQWFYAINGQRQGPVNQTEFERLVRAGTITADTLVWRKPMPAWQSLDEVRAVDPVLAAVLEAPVLPEAAEPGHVVPLVAPVAEPAGAVVYGGFWRRVGARLIDGLIVWISGQVVIGVLGMLFFRDTMMILQKVTGPELSPQEISAFLSFMPVAFGVYFGFSFAYEFFSLRQYSATPGKLALGLKVVRADGAPLSVGRIIGRYFAHALNFMTLGIGYVMVAVDDEKRGLHDYVSETRVVKTR